MSTIFLSGVTAPGPLVVRDRVFDAEVYDSGQPLREGDLHLPVTGPLPVTVVLAAETALLADAIPAGLLPKFTNGSCLIFRGPPALHDGRVEAAFGSICFYAKALARGGIPAAARERFGARHGRAALSGDELFDGETDPMRWPAAGVSVSVILVDPEDGTPRMLLHRRASNLAAAAGSWGPAVGEAFDPRDVIADNTLNPYAAARRGILEELGLPLAVGSPVCNGVYRVGAGINGYGFHFDYTVQATLDTVNTFAFHAIDACEADQQLVVDLNPEAVATFLTSGMPMLPVVALAMLRALERYQPGGATLVAQLLSTDDILDDAQPVAV